MRSTDLVPTSNRVAAPRGPRRMLRSGVLIVGAAAVVAGVAIGGKHILGGAAPASSTQAPHLTSVTRGTLVSTVSGTGTLAFAQTMNLTPKLSGTLSSFNLQVGDTVTAGQAIASLDPTDLNAQISQAEISVKSTQAKLDAAESPATTATLDAARASLLSAQQKLQQTEHPYTAADIAAQQAAVGQAEAQLQAAEHPYSASDIAAQKAAVDLAATQLNAAEHPYTSADLAAQADDFSIRNQQDLLDTSSEVSATFTDLLGGIAVVSLIVGGIGIMNIMLVSVTERTREIGIRKAVGATGRVILARIPAADAHPSRSLVH